MVLPIYTGTENDVLREVAKSVKKVTKQHLKLIKNMKQTMVNAHGLGLAAPQVGVGDRILIANFQYGEKVGEKNVVMALINPEIIKHSDEEVMGEEGCLSLPEVYAPVKRYKNILVRFLDEKGNEQHLELSELNARIIQHEIDHLDGKLFVDYLDEAVIGKYEKELAEANQF
ncbi:MAG: peptide deformylase [Candidatus Gracilibacteria bacterium]|nr:peptide deformylase [Candidatus Gracilibacteria bacterium]